MKKIFVLGGCVILLSIPILIRIGIIPTDSIKNEQQEIVTDEEQVDDLDNETIRDFDEISNNREYSDINKVGLYSTSSQVSLQKYDTEDIIRSNDLPSLERMSSDDSSEIMSELQVLKRIESFGIDVDQIYTPEYNWKKLYEDSLNTVDVMLNTFEDEKYFEGKTASELNKFLKSNEGNKIIINVSEIKLDETIIVPANTWLVGNDVKVKTNKDSSVEYGILIENVSNVCVEGFHFTGNVKHAIYIISVDSVLINNNTIEESFNKGIVVMGDCQYVNLVRNSIFNNGDGAIFLNGKIGNCIIENNVINGNLGAGNLSAAITLSSLPIENIYTPYNPEKDEYLYEIFNVPFNNVIRENTIKYGYSSGIYSHGGYQNYIIDNQIIECDKEGMCLDFGTFGTYVSSNVIINNGGRNRQSDSDLENDFIGMIGRMEDGSSPAKLPGISLDNAAYNLLIGNKISENFGSGVKMVRSCYRNLIMNNEISDNNYGENEQFHFFGVELGYAKEPDKPVVGMDFTADYENIICRNLITGKHYSGVYLAEETYCNDLFDNVIMGSEMFSVECLSDKFNSVVGNCSDMQMSGINVKG